MIPAYDPPNASRSTFLEVRGLRLHVRRWGEPQVGRVPLVLLHGWMDVSASWQFFVDAMTTRREVIAPDWRGFGLTESPPVDHYQFDDYLADLDVLLDRVAPGSQVDLVGHSMGGNVAMLYAGARPDRLRRLVNLEGFGMPDVPASEAASRHSRWLDELAALARGETELSDYGSIDAVAQRLMRNNRRLQEPRAVWLAAQRARPVTDAAGVQRWRIRGDAAHRVVLPRVYRADEVLAHYRAIACPVLAVHASDSLAPGARKTGLSVADFHRRLASVPNHRTAEVADAGHMLHHDQPAAVARLVEDFCTA